MPPTEVDMSKPVWRVEWRDEKQRRCFSYVNADSKEEAMACRETACDAFEINPADGQRKGDK